MSVSQPILVIQNTPRNHPRRFGDWWRDDGLTLDIVTAYDGAALPASLGEHAGLVVLGGGYMPDDDDRAPWLARTRDLARQALETAVPVLGICLGGQLLAHVAGGLVRADAGAPERGSTPIDIRADAADDPLFHSLPATVTAIENHVDEIETLPPEAVWLASSARCSHQAFRVGDWAWGVQFHPEVSAADVAGWDVQRLSAHGADPDEVIHRAQADEPSAVPVWREVARRFAEQVRSLS